MTSLVQLRHQSGARAVCVASGADLRKLRTVHSVYELAQRALSMQLTLQNLIEIEVTNDTISYDAVYEGKSEWRLLPVIDHPSEPARVMVTGTGLTHRASVDNRNAMHAEKTTVTDSMRMYQWGVEGGRPAAGEIGVSPEWFYKGNGTILRGHGDKLEVPAFGEDGGEESEIAGVYLIDAEGTPRRLGMAQGNEFSDHVFEKKNYLYLASSKLRECSIGPELVVDPDFSAVPGTARIWRGGTVLWEKAIKSGEDNMCHTLENMEHHHFKFPLHRRAGDVHVHYFGASGFSFGDQIKLEEGDVMEVNYQNFGKPLRNPIHIDSAAQKLAAAKTI